MWVFANDVLKIKKLDIKEILNTLSPHKYKHLFQQTQDKKKKTKHLKVANLAVELFEV